MADERDPLLGAILADRYKVVNRIGQGGAGHVYRGIQLQLEREVAIKVVRPDVAERSRSELEARFFREASLAGRLSHPSVVHTIDYGTTDDGRQFVVMELLRGHTLKHALRTPMSAAEAARLGAAVARGLHHAHSRGLVHRDVKSSNVFLVQDDEGVAHPKLLDFGLVKSVRRELDITQTPTYLGTPLYMSPEQARGELDIDARSDIYSLGCLLYRMVSGHMPYRAESAMATALMHVSDPYPPMADKVPDLEVDPELEAIVARCLEKDRDDRWPDAAALAQALDAWLDAQREPAAPTPPIQAPRSGPINAIFGAIGVLGLLGLLVGGLALLGAVAAVVLVLTRDQPTLAPDELAAGQALADEDGDQGAEAGAAADPSGAVPAGDSDTDTAVETAPEADSDVPAEEAGEGSGASGRVASLDRPDPGPRTSTPPAGSGPTRNVGEDVLEPGSTPTADPVVEVPDRGGDQDEGGWSAITVDKYTFRTEAHARATLALANQATREELLAAGVSEIVVDTVIEGRPYASVRALGATRGIGPKTMYSLATQARK